MNSTKPATIAEYVTTFSPEVQELLEKIRVTVKNLVPDAEEVISYGIPAYSLNKTTIIYFGAFKQHIGFYALSSGNQAFKEELAAYKVGRGSIQFPLDKPLPLDLIAKIVTFRLQEIAEKEAQKKAAKRKPILKNS